MSDLWPVYARVATPAEGQNAEPGDATQKMYECVYATTAVCLQALGYPDTEPTALMNLVHPGGHVGGEDYSVVASFLRSRPDLWPNLPTIALGNPADTLAYIRTVLAAGYAVQVDVKDDRNANPVSQWPPGWQGTHSVIVVGDAPLTIWNPWAGDKHAYSDAFFRAATGNPAGNFMVFARDIRSTGGNEMLPGQFFETCVRDWFWTLLGRQVDETTKLPNGATEFSNWHAQLLPDGSNMGAVYLDLSRQAEAVAYRAKLSRAIAGTPASAPTLGPFDARIVPK